MNSNTSTYSSRFIMEEIKARIKEQYKSQENFAFKIGYSRKQLNRILNHGTDIDVFFRICELLGIKAITID